MNAWRDELKKWGKREFERREMERLGFWPPSANPNLGAQLRPLSEEMREVAEKSRPLRLRVAAIEAEITSAGDMEAHLSEVRRARIERVKIARAARRERLQLEKTARAAKDRSWRAAQLPHLGRGVSARLDFSLDSDAVKLALHDLPIFHAPGDLAAWLEITVGQLAWLCYHREVAPIDHYSHFAILKKSGGSRAISAPRPHLKAAQTRILRGLLDLVPTHAAAAAFRPALHIGHNAEWHSHRDTGGPEVVLRVDLKDFFPSIRFVRVAGVFASLGYNRGIATLLALLCTESPRVAATLDGEKSFVALGERFVPQGAPSSPALTNLLCRRLDARLTGLAAHGGFTYSRYADDLVFSSAQKNADVHALCGGVKWILGEENLVVNIEKMAIARRGARQSVTGLVINGGSGPRPSRRDLRRFRAVLHEIEVQGAASVSEKMGQSAEAYARGYLSFVAMVSPEHAAKFQIAHPWLRSG